MKTLASWLLSLLLFTFHSNAQQLKQIVETISEKFINYSKSHADAALFLHTNKSIFQAGESIWATAYLLNIELEDSLKYNTLMLCLVDPVIKKSFAPQKFAIINGIAQVGLTIPDTLPSGDYVLTAYTNAYAEGKHEKIFKQVVTIRSNTTTFRKTITGTDKKLTAHTYEKEGYKVALAQPKGEDSIITAINIPGSPQNILLCYHDLKKSLEVLAVQMKNTFGQLKIANTGLRPGLQKIELLNTDQKILSDTLFWKEPETIKVKLEIDSAIHSLRSNCHCRISIQDASGKPISAMFSISCSLSKTILPTLPDIRKYYYFEQFLPPSFQIPFYWDYQTTIDSINTLQGIGNWIEADTIAEKSTPFTPITGQVFQNGRKPKRPVSILLLGGTTPVNFQTDNTGSFSISSDMIRSINTSFYVTISGGDNLESYEIQLNSSTDTLNDQIASQPFIFPIPPGNSPPQLYNMPVMEDKTITLKAVTVKSAPNSADFNFGVPFFDKDCNAYVCNHDVWMCTANPVSLHTLTKPIPGKKYFDPKTNTYILYKGCPQDYEPPKFMKSISPIWYAAQFHAPDYRQEKITIPQTNTTIYWNHLMRNNDDGKASFNFYTNDLPGIYKCVIQGITDKGPFCVTKTFEVVK
ncbi:hypothetical protein [[Flexibacter] sp. ATCC 35208]|uniref:hypothetical protein n=1 Tax=[Flexibacter] sp. ATCC 35208 TaxID=1936242 RepID=UPI0009CDD12F|nr:hypothetical protein [[Flexibacter] sp. ATCC 35208]OMP75088.1 hypothetical protein BW716_31965 [[Flexibacter] sp. ATCC 35208]